MKKSLTSPIHEFHVPVEHDTIFGFHQFSSGAVFRPLFLVWASMSDNLDVQPSQLPRSRGQTNWIRLHFFAHENKLNKNDLYPSKGSTHRSRMSLFCSESPQIKVGQMKNFYSLLSKVDLTLPKYVLHIYFFEIFGAFSFLKRLVKFRNVTILPDFIIAWTH